MNYGQYVQRGSMMIMQDAASTVKSETIENKLHKTITNCLKQEPTFTWDLRKYCVMKYFLAKL